MKKCSLYLPLFVFAALTPRAFAEPHATLRALMSNGHPALGCTNIDPGFPANGQTWVVEQVDVNGKPAFKALGHPRSRPLAVATLLITSDRIIFQAADQSESFDENRDAVKWKSGGTWRTLEFQTSRHKLQFFTNVGADEETAWFPPCRDFLVTALENFAEATRQFTQLTYMLPPARLAAFRAYFQPMAAAWRALPTKPPLDPEVDRHRILAENAVNEKNIAAAINHYVTAVQIQPVWATGWYNLAVLLAEQSDFAGAADCMRRYVDLLPDAPDAKNANVQLVIWDDKALSQFSGPLQPLSAPQATKPSLIEKMVTKQFH